MKNAIGYFAIILMLTFVSSTDLNTDGISNGYDFSILFGNTGLNCPINSCLKDFNGNGITNGDDFNIFLGNFGLLCN